MKTCVQDIVSYKNAVKEITKIRSIINDGSRNFNNEENKEKRVEPASVEKYALVRPGVLAEKSNIKSIGNF